MRAPRALGVAELLEDERRGALGDDEAVAAGVEGPARAGGSSLRVDRARIAAKPPTVAS